MSDDRIEFLATEILAFDQLTPQRRRRFRSEFHRVVAARGGVVGDQYVRSIAADVLAETLEVATRAFATDLTRRARDARLSESDIELIEIEMGAALRRSLDQIAAIARP
jgi:hypothetical protein